MPIVVIPPGDSYPHILHSSLQLSKLSYRRRHHEPQIVMSGQGPQSLTREHSAATARRRRLSRPMPVPPPCLTPGG
jgi:hypothetical protein